jgi:hypothetical protein
MEDVRNAYKVLLESLKGRDHLEDIDIDGKVILAWIINGVGRCGLYAFVSGQGPSGGGSQ